MHEGWLLVTYEIRSETGNAGTGMYRRGADEHGCEFAPVAGCRLFFYSYQNALVPLAVEYISAQRQENILLYTLSGFY